MGHDIRPLRPEDSPDAIALLDQALLAFDRDEIRNPDDTTFCFGAFDGEHMRGVVYGKDSHIEAIAVKPRYRRQGIASALIDTIVDHCTEVTAEFGPRNRSFYEACGFEITETSYGHLHGHLD